MNLKILLSALLLLMVTPALAQACPSKPSNPLEYSRRDNNRCEGLTDRPATNIFTLVSFSTGSLGAYPDLLTIRIPGKTNPPPDVEVQSSDTNYRLDELVLRPITKGFAFSLDTTKILKKVTKPGSLRAIARYQDSGFLYFPVVFGQPSGRYVFVLAGPERIALPVFEIRYKNKPVFRSPKTYRDNTHTLTWSYGNAPRGTYELFAKDDQGRTRRFRFEHNPQWL